MATSYANLYVNTDIGSPGDGTSWAQAKTSVLTALALMSANTVDCTIHCKGTAADDLGSNYIVYNKMASGKRLTFQVDQADRHLGVWSDAHYRIIGTPSSSSSGLFFGGAPLVSFVGLQVKEIGTTHADIHAFRGFVGGDDVLFDSCIIVGDMTSGSDGSYGIANGTDSGESTFHIRNCVFSGWFTGTGSTTGGLIAEDGTWYIDNCTAINCGMGFRQATGAVVYARNCYADANGTGGQAFVGAMSLTNCVSSDATAGSSNGCVSNVACDTTVGTGHAGFTNVGAGTEDVHLKVGAYLLGLGTNLSGTFTTDIDGQTRPTNWSVGADDRPSVPVGTVTAGTRQ